MAVGNKVDVGALNAMLGAVAQVYFGLGTQPGTFNFDNALASVRGAS